VKGRRIPRPDDQKAEGMVRDHNLPEPVPYNTELVSSQGVSIHFWMGRHAEDETALALCVHIARRNRDIVGVTFSEGDPDGFWAGVDMGFDT
jgi:hypothetical protein